MVNIIEWDYLVAVLAVLKADTSWDEAHLDYV